MIRRPYDPPGTFFFFSRTRLTCHLARAASTPTSADEFDLSKPGFESMVCVRLFSWAREHETLRISPSHFTGTILGLLSGSRSARSGSFHQWRDRPVSGVTATAIRQ